MKNIYFLYFILMLFLCKGINAQITVNTLTCEYRKNPLGIESTTPRLSWKLSSDKPNTLQSAYEIRVARNEKELKSGKNLLWNSGKVNNNMQTLIPYNGKKLVSGERVVWSVRVWDNKGRSSKWSAPSSWEMALIDNSEWNNVNWITVADEGKIVKSLPSQYYRKNFKLDKKIAKARIYATSLGVYNLYINGRKVGDGYFAPGWTSYDHRLQYQTYDVTSLLSSSNTIGAIVGDGWYRGKMSWKNNRAQYGQKLAFLMKLHIWYEDGSDQEIVTDKNWKYSYGPIIWSDNYDGECYDFRKEMNDWCMPSFNDSSWKSAEVLNHKKSHIVANVIDLPKKIMELSPIKFFKTPKSELVADLGQNMVGWVKIKLRGTPGDTIVLKYAEVLDKDGNFYTENLRSAKATDYIILKDDKETIFEPHFTFHGFRYLQIIGLKYTPKKEDVTGIVIHTPMKHTGSFECSDPMINQLQHNIEWGQRGNFLDVPTDCPQRDERLGWTGDTQVFSMTAAFNFDVANFYAKWLADLKADQMNDGKIPHVIPSVLKAGGSSAWADACVIVPWTVYRVYGDTRILENQYESMCKWIDYMKKRAGDDFIWKGDFHFGDWLAFASTASDYQGATTVKDLIATAYFKYSTELLSKIAYILDKKEDGKRYHNLADNVKKAFIREYVTQNGRVVSDTQTAYLLALSFDLLPKELRNSAAGYLAQDVQKFKHLTTGFVGTPLLCQTLSDIGRDDLAFMLLLRKKYPSWIYPVTMGATTIWERWDSMREDGSFNPMGMNSFNHYSYGAIGEWMYSHIAGIKDDADAPAYKHFILSPHVGGNLTWCKAKYNTLYGEITSYWKIDGKKFVYNVEIPVNTSATVVLPNCIVANVSCMYEDKNIKIEASQDGKNVKIRLGSGKYNIVVI